MHTRTSDPCKAKGAELGAYDLLMCGTKIAAQAPDTLFFDAPSVIYELNLRLNNTGSCQLVTVGRPFNPSGMGIGFPYRSTFHVSFTEAILNLTARGVVDDLVERYVVDVFLLSRV